MSQRTDIIEALAKVEAKSAVVPLTKWLDNQQLRPVIARALAKIGEPYGKVMLLQAFEKERYLHTRTTLAKALLDLGATRELAPGLLTFLGMPDPMPDGLEIALRAKVLDLLGGPDEAELRRLPEVSKKPTTFQVVVPKAGHGSGYRLLLLTNAPEGAHGQQVQFGLLENASGMPHFAPSATLTVDVPPGQGKQLEASVGESFGLAPGKVINVVVMASEAVELRAFALLPLGDEFAPPAPEPWEPGDDRSLEPADRVQVYSQEQTD